MCSLAFDVFVTGYDHCENDTGISRYPGNGSKGFHVFNAV